MRLEELVAEGWVRRDVPIAPLTTYKLGGPARFLAEVGDRERLRRLAEALAASEDMEVLVLGRGSNLVVGERGFPGLVLRLTGGLAEVRMGEGVEAGAAVPLPALARAAVRAGRLGLEFFVGIPGSVGGAVRQNAGCHGSETVDVLVEAEVLDLATGELAARPASRLGLGYRRSGLGAREVVLTASFRTRSGPREEGEARMREITRWRREHQPGGTLNAGSVFKNPPGEAAGRMIDALGLKGLTVGGASVSERHANFFVAGPEATPSDVRRLVAEVQRRVREATGVCLEPEIQFVGEFVEAL